MVQHAVVQHAVVQHAVPAPGGPTRTEVDFPVSRSPFETGFIISSFFFIRFIKPYLIKNAHVYALLKLRRPIGRTIEMLYYYVHNPQNLGQLARMLIRLPRVALFEQ